MSLERFAPAKVNLFLHVGPVQPDGYHPVCSLMVFADLGDTVRLDWDASAPLSIAGPFAKALAQSSGGDNLILRARDLFQARFGPSPRPFGLVLDKQLPIAAGLGGGSSDAAATLTLMARAWRLSPADAAEDGPLGKIARHLGADVLACLRARSVIGLGRGDHLIPAPALPILDGVLVNPGCPSATGGVYRAFDAGPPALGADHPEPHPENRTPRETAAWLAGLRNDLQNPAVALEPRIGAALAALEEQPETLLSRMSGSGATCLALCGGRAEASAMAARLAAARPGWWVRACRLGVSQT